MPFTLPPLPYAEDALEPHYSANTFAYHYHKHHAGYVKKLNAMSEGSEFAAMSLEEIIRATAGDEGKKGLFNNAAQIWNHSFFWNSMTPGGGGAPTGALAEKIAADFGSLDGLKEALSAAAVKRFGSGWAWLVLDGGTLQATSTLNADTPLAHGATPLLTLDVWEHAYYLDYQNRRADYVTAFLDHLVNWDFAAANLEGA